MKNTNPTVTQQIRELRLALRGTSTDEQRRLKQLKRELESLTLASPLPSGELFAARRSLHERIEEIRRQVNYRRTHMSSKRQREIMEQLTRVLSREYGNADLGPVLNQIDRALGKKRR